MIFIRRMQVVTKKAYAKVNLSLDIVGRREDGYHLVRMVMQTLDIADYLTFEKIEVPEDALDKTKGQETEDPRIVTLLADKRYDGSDKSSAGTSELGTLPLGSDNLIYRVAQMLLEKYVWPKAPRSGVKITLEKNIPIAAGMAGGSSDAAAAFRGINELYELGIHDEDLMKYGVTLGADIPYCIMGGTALSEGIGEKLTRLPDIPECTVLVAKPKVSVSTAEAYGGYDRLIEEAEKAKDSKENDKKIRIPRPDVDIQVDAVYAGDLKKIAASMSNVLEYVTAKKHPEIGRLEDMMKTGGALNSIMSGSGPTVYGIFKDVADAQKAAGEIEKAGLTEQLFVTRPI